MIRVFKPFTGSEWFTIYRSRETVGEPFDEGSSGSSCSDDSAEAIVACNTIFVVLTFTKNSPVGFSNSNVVGGNFVVEGHVVVDGQGVGVQAEVGPSDPGLDLGEISRPQ